MSITTKQSLTSGMKNRPKKWGAKADPKNVNYMTEWRLEFEKGLNKKI